MKNKKLFISLTAVGTAILSLCVFLFIWFLGDRYPAFESFRKEFSIPGLADNACPQGMCNASGEIEVVNGEQTAKVSDEFFFISAYINKKAAPSRIYVTGKESGYVGYVSLKDTEGKDFFGHVGGIAANNSTLWVASGKNVYVLKQTSSGKSVVNDIVAAAKENGEITFSAKFNANCNAAFLYYYDDPSTTSVTSDRLYVGEFYRPGNYETDKNHRINTPSGDYNTAFAYEYNVSGDGLYGLSTLTYSQLPEINKVPRIQKIISLPKEIQGMARTSSGKLVLSRSYGLKNSELLTYDWSEMTSNSNSHKKYSEVVTDKDGKGINFNYEGITTNSGNQYTDATNGDALNVYFADSSVQGRTYSVPCMSEGLCVSGNRVYVLFESGAKKYRTFVRQQTNNVYSFIPAA